MTTFIACCGKAYSLLLRLYPATFREEFGEEMKAVFLDGLSDSRKAGVPSAVGVCARELMDFPVNAIREHLSTRNKRGNLPMNRKQPATTILFLMPFVMAVLLLTVNPRFILRLFSDSLGWLILMGIVLVVCLNLMVFFKPSPETENRKIVLALLSFVAIIALLMGPALIMVSQFITTTGTATNDALRSALNTRTLTIIVLLADCVLAVADAVYFARCRRIRSASRP
jgi:hypothetical protein